MFRRLRTYYNESVKVARTVYGFSLTYEHTGKKNIFRCSKERRPILMALAKKHCHWNTGE